MTVIIDGTNGVQSVGGSASTASFTKDGDTNNGIFFPATDVTAITTAGTERLRIDASGNAGLGVTPSAWNSAFDVFEFGAKGCAVYTHTSNYNVNLSSNAYYDSAGYKYGNTAAASYYNQYNGIHSWYTAPSGTAGNAITFTQAMTLDASGNLSLGFTGGATRLGVRGPMYVPAAGFKELGSFFGTDSQATGNGAGITLGGVYSGTNVTAFAQVAGLKENSTDNNYAGYLAFYSRPNGDTLIERARIHSDGAATFGNGSSNNYGTFAVRSISTSGGHQAFTVRSNSDAELLVLFQSGSLYCNGVYAATVGATNRDVYVGNDGIIGYLASVRASKTNITPVLDANWLLQLNPVTFNFRKKDADGNYTDETDGEIQHGLIAEEVEAVKPELCFYDEVDGKQELRGVSYSKLVTPMLKLIQQQQAAIAALEAKVAALESK